MVFFGIILALLISKCSIIGYIRCHLGFSNTLWCLIWNFPLAPFWPFQIQNKASWVIEHVWFWLLWSLMLPGFGDCFEHCFGILISESRHHEVWFCSGLFRHNFCIMRFKSRLHQRPEEHGFLHLCTLMMPTFGSHEANIMPNKMPKP